MFEDGNTTTNGTVQSSCPSNPTAEKIGKTFAYCLIFLVSLAGNTVIGIIVYKTKTMRKPINFLIVNMAMSDLLFPIFLFPRKIQILYIDSWLIGGPLGQVLCKLACLEDISVFVSIQNLVLIAVDRFGAVVFPLRFPLISSKCPFFILATWIVAIAVISPNFYALKLVRKYPGGLSCDMHWDEVFGRSTSYENYFVGTFLLHIFISLLLIAILYMIIFLKLKSHKIPGEQSANVEQQRQQRERNVLKMAIAIVLGFAVCWLPIAVSSILVFYVNNIAWPCGFQYWIIVASFMARANCALNPCICFIFSRNYREGLNTVFR